MSLNIKIIYCELLKYKCIDISIKTKNSYITDIIINKQDITTEYRF